MSVQYEDHLWNKVNEIILNSTKLDIKDNKIIQKIYQ